MLFYLTLFLIFIYFKLARVHKKEERVNSKIYMLHALVLISALALYNWGATHFSFWVVAIVSLLFFIVSALMVTAVQVGVFIDGKPFIKMSNLYKIMPYLAIIISILTVITYL